MKACDWCSLHWNNQPCDLKATLPDDRECAAREMKGPGFMDGWTPGEHVHPKVKKHRSYEVITDDKGHGVVLG